MKRISMRQLLLLLFLALIAPAADLVPHRAAMQAGAAAWLAPLLAALPVLLVLWIFFRRPRGRGVQVGLLKRLQRPSGRILSLLFLLWGVFLLAVHLARCTRRLALGGGSPLFFAILILLLCIWMACGTLPAFARACEIFYLVIVGGLVLIGIFGLSNVRPDYLFLLKGQEIGGAWIAAGSVLGVASMGMYAVFLEEHVSLRQEDGARCIRKTLLFFLTLSAIVALVLGRFGAGLTGEVTRPFFQMVSGVGLQGAFQRLESLISAVWVLGDLTLLVFLLFACRRLLALVLGQSERKWQVILLGVLALLGGELLGGQEGSLLFTQEVIVPWGSLLVAILILLCFLKREKT